LGFDQVTNEPVPDRPAGIFFWPRGGGRTEALLIQALVRKHLSKRPLTSPLHFSKGFSALFLEGAMALQAKLVSNGQPSTLTELEARQARRLRQVEEHVRLENAHDLDGLMSTFGSSGFYDDEPWAEHHEGLDAVRSYYQNLLRVAPDFHIEVKRRHLTDDGIALEVQLTGTHSGAWRGLPATGRRFDFPLCAFFTFDEGDRLAGERIYYDRATVLQQLAVLSDPTSLKGRIGMLLLHPITILRAALGIRKR